MSREEILSLFEEERKKMRRSSGMSWPDRIVGIILLYALHAFAPSPEHGLLQKLATNLEVFSASLMNTQDAVKDHEQRIRVLEHDTVVARK